MRLKEYLDNNNIKYNQFASMIGVKKATVSYYILGKIVPSPKILEKIYMETKGEVTPIDFLFLYKEKINFVEYLKDKIDNKIILKKELAIELRLSNPAITKKLKGENNEKDNRNNSNNRDDNTKFCKC